MVRNEICNDLEDNDGSNSNCLTSISHNEPLVNIDIYSSNSGDSSLADSCGSSAGSSGTSACSCDVDILLQTDGYCNSNYLTSQSLDGPLVNLEFIEDCSRSNEDSSWWAPVVLLQVVLLQMFHSKQMVTATVIATLQQA